MMDLHQIVNYGLYGLSGLFFGIFAARQSRQAMIKIYEAFREAGLGGIFSVIPSVLVLIITLFIFPSIFGVRTQVGSFVYYLTIMYICNKGWKIYKGQ